MKVFTYSFNLKVFETATSAIFISPKSLRTTNGKDIKFSIDEIDKRRVMKSVILFLQTSSFPRLWGEVRGMRLMGKMMKGKAVYRFLVSVLVAGMMVLSFAAIEETGASRAVTAGEIER